MASIRIADLHSCHLSYPLTSVRHLEPQEGSWSVKSGFDGTVIVTHHDQLGQIQDAGTQVHGLAEKGFMLLTSHQSRVAGEDGAGEVVDAADSPLKEPSTTHHVNILPFANILREFPKTTENSMKESE